MPDKKLIKSDLTKILFFGDVSGTLGRQGIKKMAPLWKEKYQADIIIANVENLAHNKGLTLKTMAEMAEAGVEMFTGGNHIWKKYEIEKMAKETDYKIAAPANDSRCPEKYLFQITEVNGAKLAVINLNGRTFMEHETTLSNPFIKIDKLLSQIPKNTNIIIDMHAEATSDKRAMGLYLDGRVSVVLGTHTHIPTADAQILEKGTGYLTDIGMVGAYPSVLGIKQEIIIEKFLTESRIRHDLPTTGQIEVNAVLLEIDNHSHKTTDIKLLREIISPTG
ncbi:MAG: YmdB family metallophosphoesterase [Candidatus Komeilibacteria bacterium]|jgi:2',3'-cyclic-nucleotide 2'-phosphodiesterase|nr:YmdB family metallophosphoesterase [Candidatus Komeilibacteria bacterium]